MNENRIQRRDFLQKAAALLPVAFAPETFSLAPRKIVGAHLWVYASAFPPDWDCTAKLPEIFEDMRFAGIGGLEVMDVLLRKKENAGLLRALSQESRIPIIGTSYSANMWDKAQKERILDDVALVADQLEKCGGKTFGISVGTPGRIKTEDELDTQADVLKDVYKTCKKHGIVANLHNHTYEVENNLHDLSGTLKRLPDSKLGPDLAWLYRAGVEPVEFIKKYAKNLVYIHVRDQDAANQWTEAIGEGVINFDAISKALKEVNYQGPITIELAFPRGFTPTRPLRESWKLSRAHIKEKLGW